MIVWNNNFIDYMYENTSYVYRNLVLIQHANRFQ